MTDNPTGPLSVVAVITAQPDAAEEVFAALKGLGEATHTEEGCLVYSVARVVGDPAKFITIEKWTSQEALDGHLNSPHMAGMADAMKKLAEAPIILPGFPVELGDPAKAF
jgi:quinol monooxygenase YgiN